jgi:hypothetical protein
MAMSFKVIKLLVVLIAVLSFSGICSADQVNLTPAFNIDAAHSDNIYFADDNSPAKQSDTYVVYNPGINVEVATNKTVLSASYQLGVERFNTFDERNNSIHRIDGNLGYKPSKRWALDVIDNFAYTTDPLAFDASGDRVQRGGYKYNHFTPGMYYSFPGRSVRVGARYERIDIDYKDQVLIDSYQNGFHGGIDYQINNKTTLSFDYNEFKRVFKQQTPLVDDYRGRNFAAILDRRISSRTSLKFMGGYDKRDFKKGTPTADWSGGVYGLEFVGEFPEFFSIQIGYVRRFNDLAAFGVFRVDKIETTFKRNFADRLSIAVGAFYQKNRNDQISVVGRNQIDKFSGARIVGEFMVAKFLALHAGYEYLMRDSNIINSFTENRFIFGLGLSYGL